jgi:hypothetical protein
VVLFFQADQICYSVLCVFSYVAAGQDQSKKQTVPTGGKPGGPPSPHHQPAHHQPAKAQHLPPQQSSKLQSVISRTPTPATGAQQQRSIRISTNASTSPIPVTVESVNTQPTVAVQQQTQHSPPLQVKSEVVPSLPVRPSPQQLSGSSSSRTPPASDPPKTKAPVLPTRVPSQGSVTRAPITTGPPPAIPPRTQPVRSGSVQVTSPSQVRPLKRQSSISAMPPCTPQAPPPFFIPQRKQSFSGSSGGNGNGSPKRTT